MNQKKYNIINHIPDDLVDDVINVDELVEAFTKQFLPLEENIYVLVDPMTNARYCECHIKAKKLLELATIDVPLDPDGQPDYRANREIMEDHIAFEQMKIDAKERRGFSNIVAEFDTSYNQDTPLKIIGGQHRFIAIREAFDENIDEYHGLKIYFNLDKGQRLDVQLISNVNIAVSPDLYDRLQETARGPELRNWCQEVGFLDQGQDFSSKRQRGGAVSVREVRSFIFNFYKGKEIEPKEFDSVNTTPIICKTGKPDTEWDSFRNSHRNIWNGQELKEAGEEFMLLDDAQRKAVETSAKKISVKYAEKAINLSVLTGWAYIAGVLQNNKTRLKRHYNLRESTSNKDPLNAEAMAKGRHKSDPENYRGLGTRSDAKERGRCVELFYLQAEKGTGIKNNIVDVAIKRHYKKQANLELIEAEKNI
ncbi:MAG: hypothetical protein ABIN18_09910 [Pseudomonadota bacterium]